MTQLKNGVELETVLESHPEEADELRPLLAAFAWMQIDIPAPTRRVEGKQALMAAAVRRRREVEITQGYLNELNAGLPFEAIYAQAEASMRPLLIAAWRMFSTEAPQPDAEKRAQGKQQLMALAARKRAERQRQLAASMSPVSHLRAGFAGLLLGIRPRPSVLRRGLSGAAAMTAVLAALMLGSNGIGTAAASSLPGDAFYRVKRLGENARLAFSFDPARRAELGASFDRARLNELIDLALGGRELPDSILADWADSQRNAYAAIRRLPIAEQQALGHALLNSFGDANAVAELLGSMPGTQGLIAWLGASDEALPQSTETARLQELLPFDLNRGPMPVERPLPPADEIAVVELATMPPPAATPVEPAETLLPEAAVQFVQPAAPVEDEDEDDAVRPASAAAGDDQPAAEPTDDTQFVQPPMEDPTPEPVDPGASADPTAPRPPAPSQPGDPNP